MNNFEKFEEELPRAGNFCSSLTGKKLMVWNKFEMKAMRDYHGLYLECDVLLLGFTFYCF